MIPKQFGNQKHLGIEHYLVRLLHRILSSTDNSSRGDANAVLCLFIDWKQAFSRQCHTLGIKSFLKNGVRPSLIPLLISYFEGRQMRVKWRENLSEMRDLPGGGAMGATLGIWEFSLNLPTGFVLPSVMFLRSNTPYESPQSQLQTPPPTTC